LSPLHVAATHGLASFTERLSSLPDASTAATLIDFDGQTPDNLARRHGNHVIADVIDRLTNQRTESASREYIRHSLVELTIATASQLTISRQMHYVCGLYVHASVRA